MKNKSELHQSCCPERFYRDRRRLEERARSELKIGSGVGVNEVVNLTNIILLWELPHPVCCSCFYLLSRPSH